ncbi:Undecaprenyl-phosphate N-acetylglucosaminyl 1-phosphate transferase [Pseudoalteromonas luteoviolacea B = ATCC 29581]|nr:Undecaprenyl-phosphate N-acetylglucosaminyl 1-phosphate transferase [Pseudoalteromonas luteoviolacea B = ATCC 29581]
MNTVTIALFAFLSSYLAIFAMKPVAIRAGLVDLPNQRKKHVGAIPLIGGISIFSAVFVTALLFFPIEKGLVTYLSCAAAIVMLGVIDDYRELGVRVRLFIQTVIALVMMWGAESSISNLGNLVGLGDVQLGAFGYVFTVLAVIAAINAFNMIDGIDGLAGTMSLVAFSSVFILMLLNGVHQWSLLPLIIMSTMLPYLAFNLGIKGHQNRKIFMGDAGSMFVGLSVIWLLMQGTQSAEMKVFNPVTALWIIAVPLMDLVAIVIRRIKKGLSPFKPDRDHLHHVFMRIGFSSRRALFSIALFSMFLAAIGITGDVMGVPEWAMMMLFILIFLGYLYCLMHAWKVARFVRTYLIKKKAKTQRKK